MGRFGILAGLVVLSAASAMAQGVQGLRPDASPLQIGIGFTFISFNEVPNTTVNNSGFTVSAAYFHDWVGAEAELTDTFGSQSGKTSQLLFSGGGIRLRWPNARSLQPWAHGEIGFSHLSPNVPFGKDYTLGYKLGGGVDFNPKHSRIGYRASIDMIGNHFFGTYQLSPEASVGIVLALGRE